MGDEHGRSRRLVGCDDAPIEVCLACVLNDDGDATRVLVHFACTTSSTHISPGASEACAVELMLSHLDVGALQEALGARVADQYQALMAEEYAFDVGSFLPCVPRPRVVSEVAGCLGHSVVGGQFHWSRGRSTGCCRSLPGLLGLDLCQHPCFEWWMALVRDGLPPDTWEGCHCQTDTMSFRNRQHRLR
jgi:hypothetical protein